MQLDNDIYSILTVWISYYIIVKILYYLKLSHISYNWNKHSQFDREDKNSLRVSSSDKGPHLERCLFPLHDEGGTIAAIKPLLIDL